MRLEQRLAIIGLMFLAAGAGASQNEPGSKTSFAVRLSAENKEITTGSPVRLAVTMTNTSDLDLHFDVLVKQCKHLNYVPVTVRQVDVQLYDSEGNSVPLTLYGKVVRGQPGECAGKVVQGRLKPGESLHEEADLSREFDIKKPGRYTVRAQRFDKESKAQVKSETVTLTAAQ